MHQNLTAKSSTPVMEAVAAANGNPFAASTEVPAYDLRLRKVAQVQETAEVKHMSRKSVNDITAVPVAEKKVLVTSLPKVSMVESVTVESDNQVTGIVQKIEELSWNIHPFYVVVVCLLLRLTSYALGLGLVADIGVVTSLFFTYIGVMTARMSFRRVASLLGEVVSLKKPVEETLKSVKKTAEEASYMIRVGNALGRFYAFMCTAVGLSVVVGITYYLANAVVSWWTRKSKEQSPGLPLLRYLASGLSGFAKLLTYILGGPYEVISKNVKEVAETCIDLCCLTGIAVGAADGTFVKALNDELNDAFRFKDKEKMDAKALDVMMPISQSTTWSTMTDDEKLRHDLQEMDVYKTLAPGEGMCSRSQYPQLHDAFDGRWSGSEREKDHDALSKEIVDALTSFTTNVFVFAIQNGSNTAIRRSIKRAELQQYAARLRSWKPHVELQDGEDVKALERIPLPTWGSIDLADIKNHWASMKSLGKAYDHFQQAASRAWARFVERTSKYKWMLPLVIFGVAMVYLVWLIWNKRREKSRKMVMPAYAVEQQSMQFQSPGNSDSYDYKMRDRVDERSNYRDKKTRGSGPSRALGGKDSRNRKGHYQSIVFRPHAELVSMLKDFQKQFSADGVKCCLKCLNQWSCKPIMHDPTCTQPTLEALRKKAFGLYKEYLDLPVRQCICFKCSDDEQGNRKMLEYNVMKRRLGLKPNSNQSSFTIVEYESEYDVRTLVGDDEYIVRSVDELKESANPVMTPHLFSSQNLDQASFNHVDLNCNLLKSLFVIIIEAQVESLFASEQWSDSVYRSQAHGFRTAHGYQTVVHLFGGHNKIKLRSLQLVFWRDGCCEKVQVTSEKELDQISDHHNQCASGKADAFFALDIFVIPNVLWDRTIGRYMPMSGDNARYTLTTVPLWSSQELKGGLGIIPKLKINNKGKWEPDFAPFCFDRIEDDVKFPESSYRVGVYWADTVGGDSGCPIMLNGVVCCQHLRTGTEPDGRVAGRLLDSSAQMALRVQCEPKAVNSC